MTDRTGTVTGEAPALRLDELGRKGYRILQDPAAFCFGMDAVLLADFVRAKKTDRVIDLGTGNGILPLLLDARDRGGSFEALELQPEAAALARRNVSLNGCEDRIRVTEGDIREASRLFGRSRFEVVVTNPPYMPAESGLVNPASARAIARHELCCRLEDVLREAAALLVPGGEFFMVHRPERLGDICRLMRDYGLEPKELRFAYSFPDSPAELLLVRGKRGGRPFLQVDPPLIINREKGVYTDEVYEMYFGRPREEKR